MGSKSWSGSEIKMALWVTKESTRNHIRKPRRLHQYMVEKQALEWNYFPPTKNLSCCTLLDDMWSENNTDNYGGSYLQVIRLNTILEAIKTIIKRRYLNYSLKSAITIFFQRLQTKRSQQITRTIIMITIIIIVNLNVEKV